MSTESYSYAIASTSKEMTLFVNFLEKNYSLKHLKRTGNSVRFDMHRSYISFGDYAPLAGRDIVIFTGFESNPAFVVRCDKLQVISTYSPEEARTPTGQLIKECTSGSKNYTIKEALALKGWKTIPGTLFADNREMHLLNPIIARALRKFNRFSKAFIAEELEMSVPDYEYVELGMEPISINRIKFLCGFYEVEPSNLINVERDDTLSFDHPQWPFFHEHLYRTPKPSKKNLKETKYLIKHLNLDMDKSLAFLKDLGGLTDEDVIRRILS